MMIRTTRSGRHTTMLQLAMTLAVVGVLGCDGVFDSDDGLSVTLSVDRTVMSPTDTARIVVTVTNVGRRPVDISGGTCPEAFQILDDAGAIVAPSSKVCAAVLVLITLRPGESHVFEGRWSARDTLSGDVLPAGTYSARPMIFADRQVKTSVPATITIDDGAAATDGRG